MANCNEKNSYEFLAGDERKSLSVGALYVHIPLCRAKCRYCDFYSQPILPGLPELTIKALTEELSQRRDLLSEPMQSIFVGGGTPTALPGKLLGPLLGNLFALGDDITEFSVEANPGTIEAATAAVLAEAGVNRVSLGGQSFDAEQLELLGRIHKPDQIGRAVELLRNAGIQNINLDLMYGIPGQSVSSWLDSLHAAAELNPEHLSCYALSFEPGTELFDDRSAGRVTEVDDETQRRMYYETIDYLTARGFEHYEISNFAKPNRLCKHNMTYWRNEQYLGIGPAACSYIQGQRRTNAPDLTSYADNIAQGLGASYESERITGRALMAETLMLGLRLIRGVEISTFQNRFNETPAQAFPESFGRYRSLGAIQETATHVHISRDALFTADSILADIISEV